MNEYNGRDGNGYQPKESQQPNRKPKPPEPPPMRCVRTGKPPEIVTLGGFLGWWLH